MGEFFVEVYSYSVSQVQSTKNKILYFKVLKKNHCEAHTTKDCKHIEYNESKDIPHKTCDPTYIKKPKQHLEHKKKCLFMKHDNINHETYKL